MPDMPEIASKGSILKRLDTLSVDTGKRQLLLNDLNAPGARIPDIAERHGLVTPPERQHLELDWFTNWWPGAQPVEPILLRGFQVALTEAVNRNLPLDCYWMCEPDHEGHITSDEHPEGGSGTVEVAVCLSPRQVTVLIDTPHPGQFAALPALTSVQDPLINDPVLVVKRLGGPTGEIVTRQPQHRP
jgi:hypothetical protein